MDKPSFMAQVFIAFVDDVVSGEELQRLWQAIDSCFAEDLERLVEASEVPGRSRENWLRYMVPSGLTMTVISDLMDDTDVYAEVTPLGRKLRETCSHARRVTAGR